MLRAEVTNWPQRSGDCHPAPIVWRDVTQGETEALVLHGESLLVLGIAGVGKSHFCKGLVEKLRAQGDKVDCITKTHTASERIGV